MSQLGHSLKVQNWKNRVVNFIVLSPLIPLAYVLVWAGIKVNGLADDKADLIECVEDAGCDPAELSLPHSGSTPMDDGPWVEWKVGDLSRARQQGTLDIERAQNSIDEAYSQVKTGTVTTLGMTAVAIVVFGGLNALISFGSDSREARNRRRDTLKELDDLCTQLEETLGVSRETLESYSWSFGPLDTLRNRVAVIGNLNIPASQLETFDAIILLADVSKALRKTEGEIGNRPSTFSGQRKNAIAAAMNIVDTRISAINRTIESYRRGNVEAIASEEAALVAFASLCAEQIGDMQLKAKALPVEESMDLLVQVSRGTTSDLIAQVGHARTSQLLEPIRTGNIPVPARLGPPSAHDGVTRELATTLGALHL